jgi:hypothetical protein
VAFIGLPPLYHGSTEAPFDLEIKLANAGVRIPFGVARKTMSRFFSVIIFFLI